jgi:hypothetical protein
MAPRPADVFHADFAAWEQPELFVSEKRAVFRSVRG